MSDLSPDMDKDDNIADPSAINLSSKEAYAIVKQLFMDEMPSSSFPTFEEWVEYVDKDNLHPGELVDFVRPMAGAAGSFAASIGMDTLRKAGFTATNANSLKDELRQRVEQGVKDRVRQTASDMFEKFSSEGGDGGTSKANYQGGSRWNPSGLSDTLKPIESSFRTDIPFQGVTRYWQDGGENTGPLFTKSGTPGLVSPADNVYRDKQLWDFISGPVTTAWNAEIAARITWTGRVKDLLTEIQISDFINRCLYVCCVYYYHRSVIAFTNDPKNRNSGMDALRDQLTPNDYNNLFNLRREMMQSAIPPFVHEWCFHMMGTYRQNHLPSSPLMKILPFAFATTSLTYFTGEQRLSNGLSPVDVARGHLNQLREFNNVLSRAIGTWGGIEPFEYTSSPRVDMDYTTFWTNARYSCTNTTGVLHFPMIDTPETELVMNTHTDAPDGWISAMMAPTVESNSEVGVGLFHDWVLNNSGTSIDGCASYHSTNKSCSCFIYTDNNQKGFYPVETAQRYQSLSGNTFSTVITSSVWHRFQKFGTERIILTSRNALRQANYQFIDLLYTTDFKNLPASSAWNSIRDGKIQSDSSGDGRKGSGSPKPYRGRKRSSGKGGKGKSSKARNVKSNDVKDEL